MNQKPGMVGLVSYRYIGYVKGMLKDREHIGVVSTDTLDSLKGMLKNIEQMIKQITLS
jgi:hypothetical protein